MHHDLLKQAKIEIRLRIIDQVPVVCVSDDDNDDDVTYRRMMR